MGALEVFLCKEFVYKKQRRIGIPQMSWEVDQKDPELFHGGLSKNWNDIGNETGHVTWSRIITALYTFLHMPYT